MAARRGALVVSLAATSALLSASPLTQLLTPGMWQPSAHEQVVRDTLAQIPDNATVAASNSLAPQLTNRTDVSLIGIVPIDTVAPRFIVADASIPQQYPMNAPDLVTYLAEAEMTGYTVVDTRDGVALLEHRTRGTNAPREDLDG